jgi:hypothetical protein
MVVNHNPPAEADGWDLYLAALNDYRREANPATTQALIEAYATWGAAFGLSPFELHIEGERLRRALIRRQKEKAA